MVTFTGVLDELTARGLIGRVSHVSVEGVAVSFGRAADERPAPAETDDERAALEDVLTYGAA